MGVGGQEAVNHTPVRVGCRKEAADAAEEGGKKAKSKREMGNKKKETVEEEVEARQRGRRKKQLGTVRDGRERERERTWIPIGAVTWRGELPITRQRQERDD
ncbi:hypothetical protein ASPFODRAFT_46916 [Aspergillus luchuensis CBS 106.47]|uniref:Uncharacterized protein n=1 Tax=Aspergillus luchuensis (strain CBS 106.47) TaxID=1137211 RepID=A0A1M3TGE5_ASPLC|nr:hypothetical protein ASPFODRAFT_46916 [Aspergillus luchuensis CBS 106.47]